MGAQRRRPRANEAGAPQPITPSSNGFWTPELSKEFYEQVHNLNDKLKKKSPQEPEDYRVHPRTSDPSNYSLSYEDELHLADHFAFLAATEKTPESVSATVLEEQRKTPGLLLRLASNQTPKQSVIDGLEDILSIVQEHARAGKNRILYKEMLLHAIVEFSQQRIYSRLKCPQWQNSHSDSFSPLHIRVNEVLARHFNRRQKNGTKFAKLKEELVCVSSVLKGVDDAPEEEQISKLKEVVKQCNAISNHGTSNSFEKRLKLLGAPENLYQSPEVRQIDKLGKYWEACCDLIRHSRRERTRQLFENFQLNIVEAPPPGGPHESSQNCNVHGEVQLVLFYEKYAITFPPRAIGSSKSACLLCDQFVKLHGKFGISHSHKKIYIHWTIPDSTWMNPRQRKSFQNIVENMGAELGRWSRKSAARLYVTNAWAESKANVWDKKEESSTEPSVVSSNREEDTVPTPAPTLKRNNSSSSSSTIRTIKEKEDARPEHEKTMPEPHTLITTNDSLVQRQSSVSQIVEEDSRIYCEERPGTKTPEQISPAIPPNIAGEHVDEEKEEVGRKEGDDDRTESKKIILTQSSPIRRGPPSRSEDGSKTSPENAICSPMQKKPIPGTEYQENAPTSTIPLSLPEQRHDCDSHQDQVFKAEFEETSPIPTRKRSMKSLIPPAKTLGGDSKQEKDAKTNAEETLLLTAVTKQIHSPLVQQSNQDSNSTPQPKVYSPTPSITTPSFQEQVNRACPQENDSKIELEATGSPLHLVHGPNCCTKRGELEAELEETLPPPRARRPASPPQPTQLLEQHFAYRDLPRSFSITPLTRSFTLSTNAVNYTFDLEEIPHGKIDIFKSRHRGVENRVNIKRIRSGDEVDRRPEKGERRLEFGAYFGRRNSHKLRIVITWHEVPDLVEGVQNMGIGSL